MVLAHSHCLWVIHFHQGTPSPGFHHHCYHWGGGVVIENLCPRLGSCSLCFSSFNSMVISSKKDIKSSFVRVSDDNLDSTSCTFFNISATWTWGGGCSMVCFLQGMKVEEMEVLPPMCPLLVCLVPYLALVQHFPCF